MKTTLIIVTLLLFYSCTTLQVTTAPKLGETFEAKGTQNDLYIKANQWMVRTFNNAKSVIQFQDKESGKIIGKYLLNPGFGMNSNFGYIEQSPDVYALITILVKDNTTKIDIEPQGTWKSVGSGKTGYAATQSFTTEKAQENIKSLIADYKNYITSKVDEWNNSTPK